MSSNSAVTATLEKGLQDMLDLKPPGARQSIISSLKDLCVNNVQAESVLIQKLFLHFKKAPRTHKLGVLYVVDVVTRAWAEQAKSQGQEINSSATHGTYAGGVYRISELLPIFLRETIKEAPEDQKEKIKKLIDIWAKYETFSDHLLADARAQMSAQLKSTTPEGDPPSLATILGTPSANSTTAPPPVQPLPADILASLASLAKQSNTAQSNSIPTPQFPTTATSQTPAPAPAPAIQGQYPYPASAPPTNPTMPPPPPLNFQMPGGLPFPPASQSAAGPPGPSVAVPSAPFPFPPPMQNGQFPFPGAPSLGTSSQALANASAPAAPGPVDPKLQQQLALIQALVAQQLSTEQITQIVVAASGGATPALLAAPAFPAGQNAQYPAAAQNNYQSAPPQQAWNAPHDAGGSRDRGINGNRSPDRQRGRSRSRSPVGRWDSRDTRGGRDDRMGEYGRRPSPNRGGPDLRDDDYRRAPDGGSYRQRSPGRRGSSPMPDFQPNKWMEHDPNVPKDHIKVYSRTLFVGGVTCSDSRLEEIFSRFGKVQTCIVNTEKRHAFVKMYDRTEAVKAKEGMEGMRNSDMQLRTRWGVGYGPRDCSDYQTGISVIPIARLTEADRKWMLTAPYGGTGGRPIEGGWAVEEPDIEIGAGVSSKAISRRMATDRGGRNGPRSSRRDDDNGPPHGPGAPGNRGGHDGGRFNRRVGRDNHNFNRRNDDRRKGDNNSHGGNDYVKNEPAIPEFGFGLQTGPNGMPIFPPGFSFPPQ